MPLNILKSDCILYIDDNIPVRISLCLVQGPFYRIHQLEGRWVQNITTSMAVALMALHAWFCWGAGAESYRMVLGLVWSHIWHLQVGGGVLYWEQDSTINMSLSWGQLQLGENCKASNMFTKVLNTGSIYIYKAPCPSVHVYPVIALQTKKGLNLFIKNNTLERHMHIEKLALLKHSPRFEGAHQAQWKAFIK